MLKQVTASTALLLTVMAGSGSADVVKSNGGRVLAVHNVADSSPTVLSSATDTGFSQIPGAQRGVVVPASETRLFTVRFSAESRCNDLGAAANGWCSVRIVATKAGSPTVFFNPSEAGSANIRDFAFDSNPADDANLTRYASHSVTQSARLTAGTWIIRVERAIEVFSGGGTTFWLDDWNLNVLVAE